MSRSFKTELAGDFALDAFGRKRVSNPETIFDSKQVFDEQPLFWDDQEVSGSGTTSVFNLDYARTRMSVTSSVAGKRIRQTFMRFNYQPGKSQLILLTANMQAIGGGTDIIAEVGLFDDDNGLFFRLSGGTLSVVRRTNVTGTPTDTVVSQDSWNEDIMDGTGSSGVTLEMK